jgi:hypothetical protein
MELNLRPASVMRRQEIRRRQPFFILAAACFILGLVGWGCYYVRAASVERRANELLAAKVETMRRVAGQMEQVRKQTTALDALAVPITGAIADRSFWPEIIEELNARLPKEHLWIPELVATSAGRPLGGGAGDARSTRPEPTPAPTPTSRPSPGKPAAPAEPAIDGIFVRGLYLYNPRQQEVVVDFFRNLVGSPYFNVDPNNQAKVLRPSTPTNTEWAYPYELRLDLKKPVKLP